MRSATSLIQTVGRAARNSEGHVVMYADTITESMQIAIDETNRRRAIQIKYNEEHGITPTTIKKAVRDVIRISNVDTSSSSLKTDKDAESMSREEMEKEVVKLERKMKRAAADLNFEEAVELRDRMIELKKALLDLDQI